MTVYYVLMTVEAPASVDKAELTEYIEDALDSWGGQRHPDDHLFNGVKPDVIILTKKKTIRIVDAPE
jgi:ABC-type enterochelin transport system substrate-binding protein